MTFSSSILSLNCIELRKSTRRSNGYRLLSVLNLSQASFKVAKTDALIILCSVVAVCGICEAGQSLEGKKKCLQHTLSGCTLAIAFM